MTFSRGRAHALAGVRGCSAPYPPRDFARAKSNFVPPHLGDTGLFNRFCAMRSLARRARRFVCVPREKKAPQIGCLLAR